MGTLSLAAVPAADFLGSNEADRDQCGEEAASTGVTGSRPELRRQRRFPQAYRATEGDYYDVDAGEPGSRKNCGLWDCANIGDSFTFRV